jgi:peptide deformylase
MAIRDIVFVPDQVLRKKAKTVTKFDDKLQTLIDDMVETMRAAPGVGLAAPQVGVLNGLSWWNITRMKKMKRMKALKTLRSVFIPW